MREHIARCYPRTDGGGARQWWAAAGLSFYGNEGGMGQASALICGGADCSELQVDDSRSIVAACCGARCSDIWAAAAWRTLAPHPCLSEAVWPSQPYGMERAPSGARCHMTGLGSHG